MTGYEKSPDYGSPPPLPWYAWAISLAVIALFGYALLRRDQQECWTLAENEIETFERDGQTVAQLDLRRIPPGACVTIRPATTP